MCGISGIISYSNTFVQIETIIKEMARLQHHRGPDFTGFYLGNNIAFAHNRLSLLDLSENGNQPFKDERNFCFFNGKIDNFKALRKNLIKDFSIVFKSTSDTEVLFNSLKYRGLERTLNDIEGMFAFSWYDSVNRSLTIARDRFGIKPLFYTLSNNIFAFSSEIKSISIPLNMQEPIMSYLVQAFYGVYETQRHISPFKGINQLEPGHYLKLELDSFKFEDIRWFGIEEWINEQTFNHNRKKTFAEIEDEFSCLFNAAVQKMCVADAPMGTFVSGGIDSSIIAAASKKFSRLELFSANVVGKYSEINAARKLSGFLRLPLHEFEYNNSDFIDLIVDCTWHYEAPISLFVNSVPFSGLAGLARYTGIKAFLPGQNSYELFLGYPQLLTKRYDNLLKLPFTALNKLYKFIPNLSKYLNLNINDYQNQILCNHALGYKEKYADYMVSEKLEFLKGDKEELRCISLSANMMNRHLHALLWRNDRMGMMHSIESRFPFLDENLVKFGINLPSHFKISKTLKFNNYKHPFLQDKAVVRKYGSDVLPKELAYRKKIGFPVSGHSDGALVVDKSFFENGFWAKQFGINEKSVALFMRETPPSLIAKISSVEIWGSLFIENQSREEVKNRVKESFKF